MALFEARGSLPSCHHATQTYGLYAVVLFQVKALGLAVVFDHSVPPCVPVVVVSRQVVDLHKASGLDVCKPHGAMAEGPRGVGYRVLTKMGLEEGHLCLWGQRTFFAGHILDGCKKKPWAQWAHGVLYQVRVFLT